MWMVRSDSGKRYDDFHDRAAAGIGFREIAESAKPGVSRKALVQTYQAACPEAGERSTMAAVSQVYRFVNEIHENDVVVTYSPANRTYLVGTVTGPSEHKSEWSDQGMGLSRPVKWLPNEVDRDKLSTSARNSLGSSLTVFKLSDEVRDEILAITAGGSTPLPPPVVPEENVEPDPLADYESIAFERIKDQVNRLGWEGMQQLIAGILRAMGYKTQVSPPGSDLGRDILASPDGFGFERPRIVVEVKHRKQTMGSTDIRSFLGGRHPDDRGLYVSTGGFTKDARYEADRSTVPLALWTLDEVTKALLDNYESTDTKTRSLISLRTFYGPVAD
ncbi:restriction endonuclease [Mycolicibacter sinensis]|jgi:restriction system protein|uniref:restriction endonuclease n=1 Tax=Mycolicibacter sinensis (strain JDM601) TaxID=875328 RepID=UPI00059EB508|nr:restriction endonuclease [Mycolicibacter sinensis]